MPRSNAAPASRKTSADGRGAMRKKIWLISGAVLGLLAGVVLTYLVMNTYDRLTHPGEGDVAAPLRSYLEAAALGNDSLAYDQLYQGPGKQGPLYSRGVSSEPALYFGYADLEIAYSFNGKKDGYIQGSIRYHNGSSRPVSAIVRRGESGWGVYRLWFE